MLENRNLATSDDAGWRAGTSAGPGGVASGLASGLAGGYRVAAAVLAVVAVVLFAAVFIRVPDRAFADDSYFYYQVAWHIARGMGSTFNGLMPTNGYHPLWMLVCVLVFKVLPSRPEAVHGIAAVISVLDAVMLLAVARLLTRHARGMWPVAFLLLVPFCFGSQLGTEGALSGMMLALLMLASLGFVRRPGWGIAAGWSLVAGLAVLSRLDNIFIVTFVWLAVWLAQGRPDEPAGDVTRSLGRRLQLLTAPILLVLWTGYVLSNWVWFHTIQPISGMLKSTSGRADHHLGGNLPHTALIAGAIILLCLPVVVARRRRTLFFRVVELPFALGVACHAFYIVFVMSSETRWTWYYTSWILLASILLARTASVLLDGERRMGPVVQGALVGCALLLLPLWYRTSLKKFLLGAETRPPANFNAEVYGRLGIHRALAYDEPGVFAYYSDIEIVPIDGLMGDLKWQRELATEGIAEYVKRDHIDGFIGPSLPLERLNYERLCLTIFLSSEKFSCAAEGDGRYGINGVEIYARIPPRDAGRLELPAGQQVYEIPGSIVVWRLQP